MKYEIPWSSEPRSRRSVILENQVYQFYTYWNDRDQSYYFDMTSTNTGKTFAGVKMVAGLDLFAQLPIPELGNLVLLDTIGLVTDDEDCPQEGLGDRWRVYYVTL